MTEKVMRCPLGSLISETRNTTITMRYQHIRELITLWEQFETEKPGASLEAFAFWMLQQHLRGDAASSHLPAAAPQPVHAADLAHAPHGQAHAPAPEREFHHAHLPGQERSAFAARMAAHAYESPLRYHRNRSYDAQIGLLIGRLQRFARHYFKKALQNRISLDEFGFLMAVYQLEHPRKSDVINMNLLEPTTGTEILRRLIREGWLTQRPCTTDKRAKILSMTPAGHRMLAETLEEVVKVGDLLTGDLSIAQKQELLRILMHLNEFHEYLYAEHRDTPIETIIAENTR